MKDKIKDLIDCYSNRLDEIETDLQAFGYDAVRSTKASIYRVIITDLYAVIEEWGEE